MARFRQNPRTAGRALDGLVFVVTPDDHRLHTLNATAAELWRCAANGCTIDEAANAIVERFSVDFATAQQDVAACCEDLVQRQILLAD